MTIRDWFCAHDMHKIRIIRVLTGGEGPDEAGWEVECTHCHRSGWEYCDGSISLRSPPPGPVVYLPTSPYRGPAAPPVEVPVVNAVPKPKNFYLYVGFSAFHWANTIALLFVKPLMAIGSAMLAVFFTGVTIAMYFYWKKYGETK